MVRSISTGVGALLPSWVASILAFCSEPRNKSDIANTLGPRALQVLDQLIEIGLLMPPDQQEKEVMFSNFAGVPVHRRMLSDEVRLSAYRQAIQDVVKPGDVVIDAGSGTGILALYAAKAGAAKVYAIENSDFADWIPIMAAQNGMADVIELVRGNFGSVQLSEKADVLITETFGAWALAEGAAADLENCIRHNLKPDAKLIPNHVQLYAFGLQNRPDILLSPFQRRHDGIDLTPMRGEAFLRSENLHVEHNDASQLITRLKLNENKVDGLLNLHDTTKAIGLHFTLELAPNVFLPTGPNDEKTHWKQTVIACDLEAGEYKINAYPSPEDKRTLLVEINGNSYRVR
jgi:SAM-dependent methyltransferase